MTLKPGTRLGPYAIVAPIGAGGMGEVYRATDTRLDRTVAIKVLSPHLADDPDLQARFEREARARDKFEAFAGFVATANPHTKVVTYSRGSWPQETDRVRRVTAMEQRFPPLRGRIDALNVPMDRATFRNPVTGDEIQKLIVAMLGLKDTKS
jgi:hypothetical protein